MFPPEEHEYRLDRFVTIDLETSVKNTGQWAIGNHKASPFHPDNNIVLFGMCGPEPGDVWVTDNPAVDLTINHTTNYTVVGQNLKFDMLYLLQKFPALGWAYMKTAKLWDTMIVEYLLTAQEDSMISLDRLAVKYGLPLKPGNIKDYWDQGIDTEDIPVEELTEYLKHDVEVTHEVALAQYEEAKEQNMLPLITSQMEALRAVILMENNGLYLNGVKLMEGYKEAERDVKELHMHLQDEVRNNTAASIASSHINFNSPSQILTLYNGGSFEWSEKVIRIGPDSQPLLYKSGNRVGEPRMKKNKVVFPWGGLMPPGHSLPNTTHDTLASVHKQLKPSVTKDIMFLILELRGLEKQLNTYWSKYQQLRWHDGCLHHTLNQAITATGRLSSSKPNLQQVTGA